MRQVQSEFAGRTPARPAPALPQCAFDVQNDFTRGTMSLARQRPVPEAQNVRLRVPGQMPPVDLPDTGIIREQEREPPPCLCGLRTCGPIHQEARQAP